MRRSYVPVAKRRWRAEKKQMPVRTEEPVATGLKVRYSKATGELQVFPRTPEDKARIREEVWIRSGQTCQMCAKPLYELNWEMHHIVQLSVGGDWSLSNLMAVCKYPGNPLIGLISCHELLHRMDLIEKKFAHDPEMREKYMSVAEGGR